MKSARVVMLMMVLYFSALLLRPARRLWLILLLAGGGEGGEAFGQKLLKDTTFIFVKEFHPTIADAHKISDMPVVKDSVPPVPKINYSINSKKVHTPFTVDALPSAKMRGEPLSKFYQSLVKAGAGTYLYGEGFFSNLRSKEIAYGAHAKHLSWNGTLDGYGPSGFSDNRIELFGKKFLHRSTLTGGLDYNRNLIHYYNYDTSVVKNLADKNLIRQHYSALGGTVQYQTHQTDTDKINYHLKLNYYNLTDYYKTSEHNLFATGDFSGYYEKQLVHAPVSIDYFNNRSSSDTATTLIIGLSPYITASGDKWSTRIGVAIFIEGNENDKSRFLFSPNIDFNFNVVENIIVPYAGITGGLKRNSLRILSNENPFLVPGPSLKNTHTKFELYTGIRGSLSKNLSYNTRASFSSFEDLYFFVNDNTSALANGFNAAYDAATLLNVHGELQYQHTEKLKIIAKGDFNKYKMKTELRPWHKPLWEGTLSFNYNLKSKIVATADLIVYGTRYSYTPLQGQGLGVSVISTSINELKPIVDANIGLEYRYSKKLSAFLHFNNLGFKGYERWNNYPTQKFNFLAGVTMAF